MMNPSISSLRNVYSHSRQIQSRYIEPREKKAYMINYDDNNDNDNVYIYILHI